MKGNHSKAFKSHKNSSTTSDSQAFHGANNKRAASMFEFFALKKDPDTFKNLVEAAEFIEKNSDSLIFEFSFNVNCNTQFGESVVVAGGVDFLGNWDPSKGLFLQWTEPKLWQGTLFLTLKSFVSFEYKYVLVSAGSACWEKGPNRTCRLSTGDKTSTHTKFKICDVWQGF